MAERMKKVVWFVVFAFLIYAIFSNPGRSGQTVHSLWALISEGVHNLGNFFQSIIDSGK